MRGHTRYDSFPGGTVVKNPPVNAGDTGLPLGQEDPLEKGMATHSVFLPGESHGQRSLGGYSPWGRKESDTTRRPNNNTHYDKSFGRLRLGSTGKQPHSRTPHSCGEAG